MKDVKLKVKGGVPIQKPIQVIGTVVGIETKKTVTVSVDYDGSGIEEREWIHEVKITYRFEHKKVKGHQAVQVYHSGDVYPKEIGEKVLGVITFNQWGSTEFVGTHILK